MSRAEHIPNMVVLAIVEQANRWLVNRRLSGDALDGLWEFPGGKIRIGETAEEAAVRECFEEVGIVVEPYDTLPTVAHRYGAECVVLHPVCCRLTGGAVRANDRNIGEIRWVGTRELKSLAMPPPNQTVVADSLRRSRCPS